MQVLRNIRELACCRAEGGADEVHLIPAAALAWEGDSIAWVGLEKDLPEAFRSAQTIDAEGNLVLPGLIDCHTHLAFGGWRAEEFVARLQGKSYEEIARQGGGINRTVQQTRTAPVEVLRQRTLRCLVEMAALGVTTVECKSGYGLNVETEIEILRLYRELSRIQPLTIVPTFLGAHTIPGEMKGDRHAYISLLIEEMLPQIAEEQIARFCDVFVESVAFSAVEAEEIATAAKRYDLLLKFHVDQLSDGGGAELAARLGAVSADHLEFISPGGIAALAASGTVAVILPLASFFLRKPFLDGRRLVRQGVPVAVATDFNPGTAPSYHLPLALLLAVVENGLTPREALKGATIHAAMALCEERDRGSLETGKRADFVVIDAESIDHWLYHFRGNACTRTVKDGQTIFAAGSSASAHHRR